MAQVSKTLAHNFRLLEILASSDENTRIQLLKGWCKKDDIFCALAEICRNLVNGNISIKKLSPKNKRLVHSNIDLIIELSKKPKCKTKRAKLVKQSGGVLPILIPLVAGLVGETIGSLITKR